MKKIIFLLILFFQVLSLDLMAWDTTAARYFPLQIGNVWVYNGTEAPYPYCYGTFYSRYKVVGTVDTLGRTYYRIEQTIVPISGNCACGIPFFQYKIRIDSASMNVYITSADCNSNETLVDSLKARINDTAWVCPYSSFSRCGDTSLYNVCNTNLPTKRFSHGPTGGGGNFTVYAKSIGVVAWGWGELMTSCIHTLKGSVINGLVCGDTSMVVGIHSIGTEVPDQFRLYQNYPNPFNPVTRIKFDISPPLKGVGGMMVSLKIFDLLGKEVETIHELSLQPGTYEVSWDATNFPSGVYYYKLEAGDFSETRRMVLLK